ncbi:MAG: T9SS type A sorting domain-containing protein [Bacteroidia bacterium]|nr:T9SS type A sorting domain-containing protein [Bacteroidia bacterium]
MDSAYALDLPEDWTLLNPAEMNVIAMAADDTVRKTLLFQYPTSALPFYPIQMTFVVLTSPETEDFVTTISCIYFTPYNTVEIWSFADFINLPRTWYFPNSSSPTRVYIYEDSIPVSNIPSEYEPTEDWQENFQSIHMEGLAYAIPMLATHPDTLVLDTTDVNAPDSLSRWDNCGPGFRRYLGTITGQVLSPFLFVYKEGDTLLPLEGLKVQIWEDDGPIFSNMLGDSVTDANGYFTKTINTCQALEGNELEIKVRIVAENEEYDIKGKTAIVYGLVSFKDTQPVDWAYNNGNVMSPLNFGQLMVYRGSFRAVHLAQMAYRYVNTNSGVTLENGLVIRAEVNVTSCRFIPNTYCGFPMIQAAQVATAAIIGSTVGVVYYLINRPEPNILLHHTGGTTENTPWHEFGHFVMWQLQGKCFTEPLSQTAPGHCFPCMSNPRLAWNEGWVQAFSMIVDNSNRNWDNESDYYGKRSLEHLVDDAGTASGQGFRSEYKVACAVFDLWDGADKFSNWTVPPTSNQYNDRNPTSIPHLWANDKEDKVSLSFEDICLAIIEGDNNAPNNQIESIQGFYKNIIRWRGCEDRAKIREVFDQNRVVGHVENFPNGNYDGFSGDEIQGIENYSYSGTLWSMLFEHERDIKSLYAFPYHDYNLATATQNGSTYLSDPIHISGGTSLFFNKNLPFKFQYGNYSTDRPASNSTMQADLCGELTVLVDDGGNVVIGDQAVAMHADVALNHGSTMILGGPNASNSGHLLINNHSRLKIESGANLILDVGAEIELAGNDAVLEIDGNLILKDNAVFTFTGSGHVVWGNSNAGPNITCGANTGIALQGSSKSDPILYVKPGAHIQPETSLAHLNLHDGTIRMGPGASISTADAAFILDNLHVALDGTVGKHNGIYVHGQAIHEIRDVEVSGAFKGITAYQMWNQGSILQLMNCEFHDCEVGLQVHTRGVNMISCDFQNNTIGYQQDAASVLSRVQMCSFENNEQGIEFKSTGGDLYFHASESDFNVYGLRFSGPGSLYSKCSSTSNNSEAGIVVAFGARLMLNDALYSAGSQHVSVGNKYSVAALFPRLIDLYFGKNDLVPNQLNANRDIYGYMALPGTTSATLKALRNHWNTTGSATGIAPSYNTDYLVANLNNGQLYPVYFDDTNPAAAPSCAYSNTGLPGSTLRSCGECGTITTKSFVDIPLDSAMRKAIGYLELVDSTQNDLTALELFEEIAGAFPNEPTEEEQYLNGLLMSLSKTAFNGACASGKISTLESINSISNDSNIIAIQTILSAQLYDDAVSTFLQSLDEAMFKHTQGFMDTTLTRLDSLISMSMSGFQSYLDYADCYVEAEANAMNLVFERDEFDSQVATCETNKWHESDLLNDGSLERFAASLENRITMLAYPSPANEVVWVNIQNADPNAIAALALWDAQGRNLQIPIRQQFGSATSPCFVLDTRMLSAGIYIIRFQSGDKSVSQKLIVN